MTENLPANTLIPASVGGTKADNALTVANNQDYLPRIKLCQGNGKEVLKEFVARGGNYALIKSKDDIEDLGDSIDLLICSGRPKAMRTGDQIITMFEEESDEFKKIMSESKVKNSGCFYGPEYLVYIPAAQTFATLFMNNPTMRREAGAVHSRLRQAATITSHLIENEDFAWFGPKCGDCSSPLNIPDLDEIETAVKKFEDEKSSQIETVESDSSRVR